MADYKYKEMLGINNPFKPEDEHIDKLAQSITKTPKFYKQLWSWFIDALPNNLIKNKTDSNIPAGYTYFGQFIGHDISSDSHSDRHNPAHSPWGYINTSEVINWRNAGFDLETIYGSENPRNKKEFARDKLMKDNTRLMLGDTFGENGDPHIERSYPNDLQRDPATSKAIIADPRNDENIIVAQTQVAFIKFHNTVVKHIGNANNSATFDKARKITIRHYQYIILKDFLPRIIKEAVLSKIIEDVLAEKNSFYHPTKSDMYIPLEYAVAAFRMGHSMIRKTYDINRKMKDKSIGILTNLIRSPRNEEGDKVLPSMWLVDWHLFYDIHKSNFKCAKKIDTTFASTLGILRPGADDKRGNSLSALDLYRGRSWGLPTGQEVAKAIKTKKTEVTLLTREQIESKLPKKLKNVFAYKTPLLFYLLAEAEVQTDGNTLGDVGSQIVGETLVRLIYESPFSILKNGLEEDTDFLAKDKKTFGMPEMLKFIAETSGEDFDELNPIE